MKIDLNCDLGESFGNYKIGMDEEVIKFISSANIACGFHASDPLVMAKTVSLAKESGVSIGAHPGYPDLVGFVLPHILAHRSHTVLGLGDIRLRPGCTLSAQSHRPCAGR